MSLKITESFEALNIVFKIWHDNNKLYRLTIEDELIDNIDNISVFAKKVRVEMSEYLRGDRRKFSIPYNLEVSEFTLKVIEAVRAIPYAETMTYGEVSKIIGNEKAYRAVGNVLRNNKIPIIIPCHRVVGSNKKLTGYIFGLEWKKRLIDLEKGVSIDENDF